MAGKALAALRGTARWLKLIGVQPEAAPPSLVAALAIVPPVVAGAIFFRVTALEMLAVALGAGLAAHLAARVVGQPLAGAPVLPALVGVSLVGSGAALPWAAAVAVVSVALELGRARFTPAARLQVGMLAYAVVLLLSRGGPAVYVSPDGTQMLEPIRAWLTLSPGQVPFDPVRLYVGNVGGPIFATSMLAVVVGSAWLWYSRRLSLLVVLTFLAGAMVPIAVLHWPAGLHLDSGPLWFAAALVLADRHTLPGSSVGRPLLGFAAGMLAMGARAGGFGIESALVAVAAMQLLMVTVQGLDWIGRHPQETRTRLRELQSAAVALGRQQRPRPAQPPGEL